MPDNENFLAFESNGILFWRDIRTGECKEIGITQKTARAIQDALESTIKERDEYFEMLVASGLMERPRAPQDVAREALEEARAARAESSRMADTLQLILSRLEAHPAATAATQEHESNPAPQPVHTDKGGKK